MMMLMMMIMVMIKVKLAGTEILLSKVFNDIDLLQLLRRCVLCSLSDI